MGQAFDIHTALERDTYALGSFSAQIQMLLSTGRYAQARSLLQEKLQEVEPESQFEMLYVDLCSTWFYDRNPEGLEWARKALRGLEAFFVAHPTADGHMRELFIQLGFIERIFCALDAAGDELRSRIGQLKERLRAAGYRVDGRVWLPEPVELDELPRVDRLEGWSWVDERNQGAVEWESGQLRLCLYQRGQKGYDPLRLACRLAGDFTLQATIHAGSQVEERIRQIQQTRLVGQTVPHLWGVGGLQIRRDPYNLLWLNACDNVPGQVRFRASLEGQREDWGHGLFGEGPLRLRLERRGTTFYAYAGHPGESWYSCGRLDLPGWDQVEVGIIVREPWGLGALEVEKIETRFRDIAFVGAEVAEASALPEDLYALPVPTYAPDLPEMVAASEKMRRVLEQTRQVAGSRLPALVCGETGTGKECIAHALHRLGGRSGGPFVPLNCAALAPELLERELFGHVRGAYTGAYENRGGLFEAANRGILFLDEIDKAGPELQNRLLRVVEEQAVRRVGEQKLRSVDVRIVAATNCDLSQAVKKAQFRQDLYFRLKGMEIELPPLRKRQEDIPHLVAHALHQWAKQWRTSTPEITASAMEMLMGYEWPGNVRELLHAVERAAETAGEGPITADHLGLKGVGETPPSPEDEHRQITAALEASGGNISRAARRLGIHRNTLYRKMRRLGISGPGDRR